MAVLSSFGRSHVAGNVCTMVKINSIGVFIEAVENVFFPDERGFHFGTSFLLMAILYYITTSLSIDF